jgi:hypothetical protein
LLSNYRNFRSNRTKRLKILRCFPHCCPEHIDRSYCGSSLSVGVRLAERPIGTAPLEPPPTEVLSVFARFEAVSDVSLRTGECVEVDKIQRGLQSETNLGGQWIAGVLDRPSGMVASIRAPGTPSQEDQPLVFHLNGKAFSRWYYDWESGANKAQRLMKHTLKAYVMERVAVDMDDNFTTISSQEAFTQLYRVLHVVSSPEFTVISYRRAPLDQHVAAQLAKAQQLPQQVRGVQRGSFLQYGGSSPSTPGSMKSEVYHRGTIMSSHSASVMPLSRAAGTSRRPELYEVEAKRRRRVSSRPSEPGLAHPLEDKLFWEHSNSAAVAVSKNMALLHAFVRWAPVRIYAPFVDELTRLVEHKMLDPLSTGLKKSNKLNCFSRLLLQHARAEEVIRVASGGSTLPLELETLLRVASQTVMWLFSRETRRWVRTFFGQNAPSVLDKKAMRTCFLQFLRELEEHLNAEVLAATPLRSLANVAEEVLAAVYSHECFHDHRPLVRDILSGQSFAGWTMFVAQMRDTYIGATSSPRALQTAEKNATFAAAYPPHNEVERRWNGEWILDMEDARWDINEVAPTTESGAKADPRAPDVSLIALVDLISQFARFEIALDVRESSLRARSSQGLAGRLDCMHVVLDGKDRVFRMFPNGVSSSCGDGAFGDYVGKMRAEAPGALVVVLEMFSWSTEQGCPSYHVRTYVECQRNGRLAVNGEILATNGPTSFTAEEAPYVGEMSLRAKRKSVEKASARRYHAAGAPRDMPLSPWREYGRFGLSYRKA